LHLRQRGLQVRGHVVRPFVIVLVESSAFGRQPIEELLHVTAHGRRGIFLDQQRSRGVPAEQGEHSGADRLRRDPLPHLGSELGEAALFRAHGQDGHRLLHGRT
jgi:hypothetical protein